MSIRGFRVHQQKWNRDGGGVLTSKQKETTKKLAPVSLLVVVVGDQL